MGRDWRDQHRDGNQRFKPHPKGRGFVLWVKLNAPPKPEKEQKPCPSK